MALEYLPVLKIIMKEAVLEDYKEGKNRKLAKIL